MKILFIVLIFIVGLNSNLYAKTTKQLKSSCDRGNASDCVLLGEKYKFPDEIEYYKKAVEIYEKDCNNGNMKACISAGDIYDSGKASMYGRSSRSAEKYYIKACNLGSANTCYKLANAYDDQLKVIEFSTKACKYGMHFVCKSLGDIYLKGSDKIPKNYDKAIKFYIKACKSGSDVRACYALAKIYETNTYGKENFSKAIKYYLKIAKLGMPHGFFYVGNFYAQAKGPQQDYIKAIHYYTKACDKGVNQACMLLADTYGSGKLGMQINTPKAEEFVRKVFKLSSNECQKGNIAECGRIAHILERGLGVEQDYFKAVELHDKACNGGIAAECIHLARIYQNGQNGMQKNTSKADEYMQKALRLFQMGCKAGDDNSCKNVKLMMKK